MRLYPHPFQVRRASAADAEHRLTRFAAEAGSATPEAPVPAAAERGGEVLASDEVARQEAGARRDDAGRQVDGTLRAGLPPELAAKASADARTDLAKTYTAAPERAPEVKPERAEVLAALTAIAQEYGRVRPALQPQLQALCDSAQALNARIAADIRQPAVTTESILAAARTLADMHSALGINGSALDAALAKLPASVPAGDQLSSYNARARPLARNGNRFPAAWGRPAYYPVRPAYGMPQRGPRGYYNAWPGNTAPPYWRGMQYPRSGVNIPFATVRPGEPVFPPAGPVGPMPGLPPMRAPGRRPLGPPLMPGAQPPVPGGEQPVSPERQAANRLAALSPQDLDAAIQRNDGPIKLSALSALGINMVGLQNMFASTVSMARRETTPGVSMLTLSISGSPIGTLAIYHGQNMVVNMSTPQEKAALLQATGMPAMGPRPPVAPPVGLPGRPRTAPSYRPAAPRDGGVDLPANHPLRGLDAQYKALPEGSPQRAELVRQYREQRGAAIRAENAIVYVMKDGAIEKGVVKGGQVVNTAEQWSVPLPADMSQVWLAAELEGGLGWEMRDAAPAVPRSVPAEFKRRQFEFLDRNATIDVATYHQLFDGEIKQKTGNCYLIAMFKGLQESDAGEAIIRTSVRPLAGGAYEVRVPMGSATSPWCRVEPGDLIASSASTRPVKITLIDENNRVVGERIEQRPYEPVQGATGWKVLEAAYIKYAHRSLDVVGTRVVETGPSGRLDRGRAEGGNTDRAAGDFIAGIDTSFEGRTVDARTLSANPEGRAAVERMLDNFSNGRDLLVAGSRKGRSDQDKYTVGSTELMYNHAYMLRSVNKAAGTVTLWEPNNTRTEIVMTREEFYQGFRFLHGGSLNYGRAFGGAGAAPAR